MMTIQDFARSLNGREYPFELTKTEEAVAKERGFLVVCWASDDLTEFMGAFADEGSAPESFIVRDKKLVPMPDEDEKVVLQQFGVYEIVTERKKDDVVIRSIEDPHYAITVGGALHAMFSVMEDGAEYCRAAVVQL